MTKLLLDWLNNDIKLSKKITDIPNDFHTGYFFGELLYKTKQAPLLSVYKNSSKKEDILNNLSKLEHNLLPLNIELPENCKISIMNCDIYASKIYLYKIKLFFEKRNINRQQLKFRDSTSLAKFYNNIYLKNENAKYMVSFENKNNQQTKVRFNKTYEKNKYKFGNDLYKEILKVYSHLDLTDNDMKIILADIEDDEFRIKHIRNIVNSTEMKQKELNSNKENLEKTKWRISLNGINTLRKNILNASLNKVKRKQNLFNKSMKVNNIYNQKQSANFDENLRFFTGNESKLKEDESMTSEMRNKINEVLMEKMREKLKEQLKSKRDKEKRERQKLKEENTLLLLSAENNKEKIKRYTLTESNKQRYISLNKNLDSKNDICLKSILNSFYIHKDEVKIGNRIEFFKTKLNDKLPLNNLPNLVDYNTDNKDDKSLDAKEVYINSIKNENYENAKKNLEKKILKKNINKKLISPILDNILNITDYLSEHQKEKKCDLINDEIWQKLILKFKKGIIINLEDFEDKKKEITLCPEKINSKENDSFDFNNCDKNLNERYNNFYQDYLNYTGLFNDIIIPHELRIKKFSYIELYSDFYDPHINNVDIKDYEPRSDEIENLVLPKFNIRKNRYFYDVLEDIIENENVDLTENNLVKNLSLKSHIDIEETKNDNLHNKGKFFYLPVKISFIGYPFSGKKTQSLLINNKYPLIKIYDPENILKMKIKEINELNEPTENKNTHKAKNIKKSNDNSEQERLNAIEKLKPVIDIINPYLELIKNNSDENFNEKKEELLSDVYMKLLIHELENDFPDNTENILHTLEDDKNKYNEYVETLKKIKEVNTSIEEEDEKNNMNADPNNKADKNKNPKKVNNPVKANLLKELDTLNKNLDDLKKALFKGFIIINYPRNEKEAIKLEKYFNNFKFDYEEEPNPVEIDLLKYDIIDLNLIKKNHSGKNIPLSFLDYLINFEMSSEKILQRYDTCKYDPATGRVYSEEEVSNLTDKKLIDKLIKGVPNINKEDIEIQKNYYDNNYYDLSKFYKKMNNGLNSVYVNINTNDKNNSSLFEIIENYIKDISNDFFYKNIDEVIDTVDGKIQEKSDIIKESGINEEKEKIEIPKNIYKKIKEKLDSFYSRYKNEIKNMIYFISSQRKKMIIYLENTQNTFIEFLNRKTKKNNIIQMYIDKYNTLFKLYPNLKQNKIVYNELLDDISNVNNSIWVKIQTKKNENIKYLEKVKNSGEMENNILNFIQKILSIFEIEIEKYLVFCDAVIKYYLSKVNILSDIYSMYDKGSYEFLFKIDFQKYLFKNINLNFNNTDNIFLNTKSTLETFYSENITTTQFDKNIEDIIDKIFINSLKIIIKQDEVNINYYEKIKFVLKEGGNIRNNNSFKQTIVSKNYNQRASITMNIQDNNNSVVSSKSYKKKNKSKIQESILYDEKMKEQIDIEKNKLKYRLMFIKTFALRYIKIINSCYNKAFDCMDQWIILNMKTQNNKLNEFIEYLKRALNYYINEINMSGREFDYNDLYFKNKKMILPIYKNIYPNKILNLSIQFGINKNYVNNLITKIDLNNLQKYIYNINDLFNLYNLLKEFSSVTSESQVKYEIVKEIFLNYFLNQKGYQFIYKKKENKNNNNDNSGNPSKNINEEYTNGLSKVFNFYSFSYIQRFLKIFSIHDDKYININELFTCLLFIGSELITPEKFDELIEKYLPAEKKNQKNILLTLNEFMQIPLWFEHDEYINEISDLKEEKIFKGTYNNVYSINQIYISKPKNVEYESKVSNSEINSPKKDKYLKIKEKIFMINQEDCLIDINILRNLLLKLNKAAINKSNKKNSAEKKNDVDEEDDCFKFWDETFEDSGENYDLFNKNMASSRDNVKINIFIKNNIFSNLFPGEE